MYMIQIRILMFQILLLVVIRYMILIILSYTARTITNTYLFIMFGTRYDFRF